MTHTYKIDGMTCNGCVGKVKSELLKLGDVLSADVQLNKPQATITMNKHIGLDTLQKTISKAGQFSIAEEGNHHADMQIANVENNASWLQTYKPLLLVFAFISGVSLITSFNASGFHAMQAMQYFMAAFFLVFSFFKLLNLKGFADSYSTYDLLAQKVPTYGYVYPFIELALGVAYLVNFNPQLTNVATIVVMGFSSIGVIRSVLAKRKIQCACLGAVFNLPMSTVTIVEDLLMVAMAVIMLVV